MCAESIELLQAKGTAPIHGDRARLLEPIRHGLQEKRFMLICSNTGHENRMKHDLSLG
jgi:hypothetical protein